MTSVHLRALSACVIAVISDVYRDQRREWAGMLRSSSESSHMPIRAVLTWLTAPLSAVKTRETTVKSQLQMLCCWTQVTCIVTESHLQQACTCTLRNKLQFCEHSFEWCSLTWGEDSGAVFCRLQSFLIVGLYGADLPLQCVEMAHDVSLKVGGNTHPELWWPSGFFCVVHINKLIIV